MTYFHQLEVVDRGSETQQDKKKFKELVSVATRGLPLVSLSVYGSDESLQ